MHLIQVGCVYAVYLKNSIESRLALFRGFSAGNSRFTFDSSTVGDAISSYCQILVEFIAR